MYKFEVYQDSDISIRWAWRVTREIGPAVVVVARSGIDVSYVSKEAAKQAYKDFVDWASKGHVADPSSPANA